MFDEEERERKAEAEAEAEGEAEGENRDMKMLLRKKQFITTNLFQKKIFCISDVIIIFEIFGEKYLHILQSQEYLENNKFHFMTMTNKGEKKIL